jgi:hypothetical protein
MGTPTYYYVDPGGGNDTTGDGSIGTPWATVQHALDNITRDSTNGDQINIKAGTDDVLSAALDYSTYGASTAAAPLTLRGYTSTANDGGMGGISCGGGSYQVSNAREYVHFIELDLHNVATLIINLGRYSVLVNCNLYNSGEDGMWNNQDNVVAGCYFSDIDRFAALVGGIRFFSNAIDDTGAKTMTSGFVVGAKSIVENCVFRMSAGADAIKTNGIGSHIVNNSIYTVSGTSSGIYVANSAHTNCSVANNIISGYSGVGGIGIEALAPMAFYGNNKFYNNTTNESIGDVDYNAGNNDNLGADPFTDASSEDYTVTSALKALGYPLANYPNLSVRSYTDPGALQRQEPAGGGGGGRRPRIRQHGV